MPRVFFAAARDRALATVAALLLWLRKHLTSCGAVQKFLFSSAPSRRGAHVLAPSLVADIKRTREAAYASANAWIRDKGLEF